jgi:uncharacterized radical SAM superfamily Fe-S cluster-containing enzyme
MRADGMNVQNHWERIYGTKAPEAASWYQPRLEISLKLIERAAPDFSASIIDVGGGESTLVDDLLALFRGLSTNRSQLFLHLSSRPEP